LIPGVKECDIESKNLNQRSQSFWEKSITVSGKLVKETLPLEAFHGRHSRGVDLNHIKFLYIKIVMLEEEQVQRDNFCWFHKMKEIRQKYDQSDIIKYIYIYTSSNYLQLTLCIKREPLDWWFPINILCKNDRQLRPNIEDKDSY